MKGEVRNPLHVWLFSLFTCGFYGIYMFYVMGNELKNYLGKEDLNPTMDLALSFLCFPYSYYLPIKYGKLIQEAQQRAGLPNPEDKGVNILIMNMFVLGMGFKIMQEELNKVWEAGGGQPTTF